MAGPAAPAPVEATPAGRRHWVHAVDAVRAWARTRPRAAQAGRLGLVLVLVAASYGTTQWFGRPIHFYDLRIYHGAVAWWASGGDLYRYVHPPTGLGFTYPPFAAIVMRPMAELSVTAAGWLSGIVSMAAFVFLVALAVRPIARRYGWRTWYAVALVVPPLTATDPIRETLGFGQVNLLLAALIFADLVGLRWRARPGSQTAGFFASGAWAGAGIGLAASVKITPALFILYLVCSRQWRAAFVAVGTAVGATFAAWMIAGHESWTYFSTILWQTERVGAADMTPNQALTGILARLFDSTDSPPLVWFSFALVLLAIGISRAVSAHRDGDEYAAFVLVGLTGNAICPISWTHHLVFAVLAIIVLADAAVRRRTSATALLLPRLAGARLPLRMSARFAGLPYAALAVGSYVLYVVSPVWDYSHLLPTSHYADGTFGWLAENSLGLVVLALVAVLPWRPGAAPAFTAGRLRDS
ncbi:glycosyltransferase 87 family protein [Luedemannella flava]